MTTGLEVHVENVCRLYGVCVGLKESPLRMGAPVGGMEGLCDPPIASNKDCSYQCSVSDVSSPLRGEHKTLMYECNVFFHGK